MRLFKEEPKWTPLNRGPQVDENPCRKEYIQSDVQFFDINISVLSSCQEQ